MRDRLAWAIATRWAARVTQGHGVSWGTARIERGGLRLKDKHASGQLFPLHELQFLIDDGTLTVQDGRGRKLLALATSVENFYPGLMLVKLLLEAPQPLTAPRAQGA